MAKLILHIGTHKTGTTTIQKFAARNREALAQRGLYYPSYDLIGKGQQYAHHSVAKSLAGLKSNLTHQDAVDFLHALGDRVGHYPNTLISAEPFYRCSLPVDDPELSRKARYRTGRNRYIRLIKELIGEMPVQLLLVFRNPATYAQSLYQEHIKVTGYRGSFTDFLKYAWHHFDYLGQIKAWARAFPDARVAVFEDLVSQGSLHLKFFDLFGVSVAGLEMPADANVSLPTDVVLLKRALNRLELPADEYADINQRLIKFAKDNADHLPRKRLFWESHQAMVAFDQAIQPDIAELLATYPRPDGDYTDPAKLALAENWDGYVFGDEVDPEVLELARSSGLELDVPIS